MAEIYGYTGMINPAKDESRLGTGWYGDGPPVMGYMPPAGGGGTVPTFPWPEMLAGGGGGGAPLADYKFPDIFDKPAPKIDLSALLAPPTLSMGGPAAPPTFRGGAMPPVGPPSGPVAEYSGTMRPGAMGGFKPDALVNMIGGAAENTGIGGLLKSMFPDAWYDFGEAMKGNRRPPSSPAAPTPSQTYDAANQAARDRAIANSSNPESNSARASLASRWGFD